MQTQTKISTHKIVLLLVFLCAAIITSLFIFHSQHPITKSLAKPLDPEKGMIFPAARDIKHFELIDANNQKFTLNHLYNHWTLVFFGFTHCAMVCPTTLDLLKRTYPELHAKYSNLQVLFVSLDPARDNPQQIKNYLMAYDDSFIGVTGNLNELRKLQSQLGIFSQRQGSDANQYQIQHTSSILLINPQGKWAGLFKYGLTPAEFSKAVDDGIGLLT